MTVTMDAYEYKRRNGTRADPRHPPDLLIEIPHGATKLAEFFALREFMRSTLPDRLEDFFLVNTDAGAPELAACVAELYTDHHPDRSVAVLRSCIPRTFIDCNRQIDLARAEPGMTPGVYDYIREREDVDLLVALHTRYQLTAHARIDEVCGAGGTALLLHTYAPRSVNVQATDDIPRAMREAWATPEKWLLRPPVDLISRLAKKDVCQAPPGLLGRLRGAFGEIDIAVADNETYHLHPGTMCRVHTQRWPGQIITLEVRRDLLTDCYEPFVELAVAPQRVALIADALTQAIAA